MATKKESRTSTNASAALPGFAKSFETLSQKLADKGTPGILLLAVMFFAMWAPVLLAIVYSTSILKEFQTELTPGWPHHILPAAVFLIFVGSALLVSYSLGRSVIGSIVPTISAESSVQSLTSALGGRLVTEGGGIAFAGMTDRQAKRLSRDIMKALASRTAGLTGTIPACIRSNIFVADRKDGYWMTILDAIAVNMDGSPDLGIKILSGFYSTGTAFLFSRAVFSKPKVENDRKIWPYKPARHSEIDPYTDEIIARQESEISKGHPQLAWIVSMPIPYQVVPFTLSCGVLNIDCIGTGPDIDSSQLRTILRDTACAAALIGVMNRSTDFLEGHCQRPLKLMSGSEIEKLDQLGELYAIAWEEFDPTVCPEPSPEFVRLLSRINGLEFLSDVSTADVAQFVRLQLKN